ncbi:MAG: glutathione S-transferase family protein [Pseudomonadota bacterium]|jgi:glutathione S-transferase
MQIFYSPKSRSFAALWAMEETGEPYEKVLTDINTGDQKKPEYLAVNPMGKVPGLKDGDAMMGESAAICAYIADRYPNARLAPPIGDPRRARYLQWLFFNGNIEAAITQVFTKIQMPPRTAGWGDATQVFDVLDAALAKGPWILGEQFTAADIVIGAGVHFAVRAFKMVPARPAFDRYLDLCEARPAYQRAEKLMA